IPGLGHYQIRIVGKTALDPPFVKLFIIQGSERPRQSPERPDQPELGGDDVNGMPEPHLLRKRETVLGYALRLGKRVAHREQIRVQLVGAIGSTSEVADPICRLER